MHGAVRVKQKFFSEANKILMHFVQPAFTESNHPGHKYFIFLRNAQKISMKFAWQLQFSRSSGQNKQNIETITFNVTRP